jgi:hypothetical protein
VAGKSSYLGPDQRKQPRRQKSDRRDAVRWDKDKKETRRQTFGRRKADKTYRLPKK